MLDILKSGESISVYLPFSAEEFKSQMERYEYLSPEALYLLREFLVSTKRLKERHKNSRLREYFNRLGDYEELISEIEAKLDDNREIKDDASINLYKIRMRMKAVVNEIKKVLKDLLESKPYLFSEGIIVERNQRFVLPLRVNFKNEMVGIVHAYSNTRETVFIEPVEVTPLSAEMADLKRSEEEEIVAILKGITRNVRLHFDELYKDLDYTAELDLLLAKAHYARRYDCSMPVFGNHFDIKNGYHPLLKHIKRDVVPLNLLMPEGKRVLLISGPNAGGKTVALKTIGLLCLMAQCGLFIPSDEGTTIPFFDEIYADIGDEQNLESDLSTFAAHIRQIKTALNSNNGNNLVLLDELMNQTSVEEGTALASAIMEELSIRDNFVFATTHNEGLKIFVSKRDDMLNAGMEFTDRPTYRLILGIPQPSNAIKLAEQMGIKRDVIERARSYLDTQRASLNELFENLSKELKEVHQQKNRLETLIKEYETKSRELELKKKREMAELKERDQKELQKARRRVDELIKALKSEGPKPDLVKETKKFFAEVLKEEPKEPYYPAIGEVVRVRGSNKTGIVVECKGERYKISFGNLIYWARPEEIEPETRRE